MKRPAQGQKGFTLVELLTVIVIIAILIALLFPVLGGAMAKANATKCLSNMRQWGTALTLYLSDSGSALPWRGAGAAGVVDAQQILTNRLAWYNALPPYVGTPPYSNLFNTAQIPRPLGKSMFICPAAKPEPGLGATDTRTYYSSYAQNYWVDSGGRGCGSAGGSGFGQHLRLSQIKNPAVFPVFAENATAVAVSSPEYQFAYTAPYWMGAAVGGDAFRHNGMANIVFADGHAASFHKGQIYIDAIDDPYWNYGGIQWNPDNPNLDGECP